MDQVKIEPPGRNEEEESDQEFGGMQVYSLNLNCEPGWETQMSSSSRMPKPMLSTLPPSSKADITNGPQYSFSPSLEVPHSLQNNSQVTIIAHNFAYQ